jgi:phosphoglucosamine mutase
MANMVLAAEADYGIALDGDGDRIMMADASGRIFSGDELLYAIVKHRVSKRGKVAVGGVVGTLMTNLALEQRLGTMGLDFRRAKVGDRYVMEMLKETGWQLGGETSGHLLCLDRHTTGDGIISALQVLAAVVGQEQSLSDYVSELKLLPQVLVNRRLPPGFDWQANASFQSAYQTAKQSLRGQGRILIRPSGTEPLLRIMVEHESAAAAADMAEGLAAELPAQ